MKLPLDQSKYNARFKYVEVAKYVPSLKSVIREKKDGQIVLIPVEEIEKYSARQNRTGIYTSIFQYDSQHLDSATSLGSLCFDLDSDDLEISRSETIRLVEYLLQHVSEGALRVYFSGGKGFHVECEPIALNISSSDDITGISRFIAGDITEELSLTTTDLVVYDKRRMWRVPNTRHQRTGLFKVECMQLLRDSSSMESILEYAKEPHDYDIPEQVFELKANRWYREYVHKYEKSKLDKPNASDLFARFLEQGTGSIKHFSEEEKVFDKFKLLKNCPAVRTLEEKARTNHHLDHYERLFLCSLLTYTEDSIIYLQEIMSNCSDYNPDVSTSHIEDWISRREYGIGGRPFTCAKAKEVGITCSGCDIMEPKSKVLHLSDGRYIETGELSAPSPIRHGYTIPRGNKNA